MSKNFNRIRRIGIPILILLLALIAALAIALKQNRIVLTYTDLGVPNAELYGEEQINSRLAEDMTVFDGRLFVGSGDYDANTGPVCVASCDLDTGIWEHSDPLPDEQIKRFRVLKGELVTLGTDPTEEWDLGNYYVFKEGVWEIFRNLHGGVHCFDALEFEGKLFFALGVSAGNFPAVVFDDVAYSAVGFYKDGKLIDTTKFEIIRVYNLFTYKGELFAFLTLGSSESYLMDLYRFDGENFVYSHGSLPGEDMPDVISWGERLFMVANSTLLVSDDLLSFNAINLGKGAHVADITESNGKISVLTWRELALGYYEVAIFEDGGDGFSKVLGIITRAPAGAFCKDGSDFYISLGTRDLPSRDTGRVVKVTER